jgi:hypothetical protein
VSVAEGQVEGCRNKVLGLDESSPFSVLWVSSQSGEKILTIL